MGEIADMMLDGDLCECCGEYIEGGGQGFPGYCSAQCAQGRGAQYLADEVVAARKLHTSWCQVCGKGFKAAASRDQHTAAKHGATP